MNANWMRSDKWPLRRSTFYLTLLLLLASATAGPALAKAQILPSGTRDGGFLTADDPNVRRVMDVQNSVTDALLNLVGIIGVGTGLTSEGVPAIVVFAETESAENKIPKEIDGIPVVTYRMMMPVPLPELETGLGPSGFGRTGGSQVINAIRPVNLGASVGNANDCSAGSLGVRVTNGTDRFMLSCNHVFARTNAASLNEQIMSPGRGDVLCALIVGDTIGRLIDFETIIHSPAGNNTMDAAIVKINPANVLPGTPSTGYGIPSITPAAPALNMEVRKFGKTTGLTTGMILAFNTTVYVNYAAGSTRFTKQIMVYGTGFCEGGDSGSLVVTNTSQNQPVGIVFAKSGSYTYVNPIMLILKRFNVTIDDSIDTQPVPVELTSFSGRIYNTDVELKWNTATELNNFGFSIQRSHDKEKWEDIGFIPGAGSSNSPKSYAFTDPRIMEHFNTDVIYYRLQQIDRDGTSEFSPVVEITSTALPAEIQVYPLPVRDNATIQFRIQDPSLGTMYVYDAMGRRIEQLTRTIPNSGGMQLVPLPLTAVAPGRYLIEYQSAGTIVRKSFLLVR